MREQITTCNELPVYLYCWCALTAMNNRDIGQWGSAVYNGLSQITF